jgi:mRNA-degrading endonuclease RelE of RelBE toxin-antitoxin system
MAYQLRATATAERALQKIEKKTRLQLMLRIYQLAVEPRSPNATMIDEENEIYRLGIGDFRLIYWVREKDVILLFVINDAANKKSA